MNSVLPFLKEIVDIALKEDVGNGDLTTNLLVPKNARVKAKIYAKDNGVVAGLDVAVEVFRQLHGNIKAKKLIEDGAVVKKSQVLMEISGNTRALLTGERTALNFLQHMSGIATLTRKYVDSIRPCHAKIFTTRKTIPGMRILEKYAVRMGGGHNHRFGLYDMVMLKDNHLKITSSLVARRSSFEELIRKMRKKIPHGMKIEVETENLKEVKMALDAGVDIIMLDNMSVKRLGKAVKFIHHTSHIAHRQRPIIEASGNVGLHNVKTIAKTGVDWISIGRLTHSAPSLDISMEID